MPTIANWMRRLPRKTVRPRAKVGVPVLLCVVIFAIMATVIGRLGRERWVPVNQQATYTATAQAVEKATGAATPFTITDVDLRRAKEVASVMAERYAADRATGWRKSREPNYRKARELAEKARQEHRENANRLAVLERQRREAAELMAKANRPGTLQPAVIDNPRWTDLQRQISDLDRRRQQLLVDRTPLHPVVLEVEERLTDVRKQLAATPKQIPSNHIRTAVPADVKASAPTLVDEVGAKKSRRELDRLTAAIETSRLARKEAEQAEKRALQELKAAPQFVFERPEAVENPPQVDYGWRRLIWTTIAASLLMAFGFASVGFGSSIEPAVANIEEIEAALGEPVIGVIPNEGCPVDVAAIHGQALARRTAISFGVILIVACPLVAFWGVSGI
jgi:hypothetical protein